MSLVCLLEKALQNSTPLDAMPPERRYWRAVSTGDFRVLPLIWIDTNQELPSELTCERFGKKLGWE
jgi:hypothetical protein